MRGARTSLLIGLPASGIPPFAFGHLARLFYHHLAGGSNSSMGLPAGVVEQDLLTALPGDDFAPEAGPLGLQRLDEGRQILDLDLKAVPTPGWGRLPSGMACPAPPAPAH